jgi:hypothetical protein
MSENGNRPPSGASVSMWIPFQAGRTIGRRGDDYGEIIRDEEHLDGARITLEKGGHNAPFAITCGVYSWMVHTCFYLDQLTAEDEFAAMKGDLERIVSLIPRVEVDDLEHRLSSIEAAISNFVERF